MEKILSSADAYKAISGLMTHPEQEEVFLISVGSFNKIQSIDFVALGDTDQTVIPFRYIYYRLCSNLAKGAILVHTHPSGNPTPSKADIEQTKKLREGLNTLQIGLIDHLIIGENSYYSFSDERICKAE